MIDATGTNALFDIIIPTAKYGSRTDALLNDLGRELAPHQEHVGRIVVVDDEAIYDTAPRLLHAGVDSVRTWPSSSNGPAVNRNRGAQGSTTPWLVFLDDDVRLTTGWGDRLTALMIKESTADVVGGRIGSQRPRNWFSQAAEDFVVRHRRYPEGWYLAAAHLIVRRTSFERLSGFDAEFAYGAEDWDFSRRAHSLGMTVEIDPTITVLHANPTTWSGLATKARQYGTANAKLDATSSDPPLHHPAEPTGLEPAASSPSSGLPSMGHALAWTAEEYRNLRLDGRPRLRAARTMALYIPWMIVYLRAQRDAS